jgi:hypothetical protein
MRANNAQHLFGSQLHDVLALRGTGRIAEATSRLESLATQAAHPVELGEIGSCQLGLGLFEQAEATLENAARRLPLGSIAGYRALRDLAEARFCLGEFAAARQLHVLLLEHEWLPSRLAGIAPNDPSRELLLARSDK